jgi:hypothetical protein
MYDLACTRKLGYDQGDLRVIAAGIGLVVLAQMNRASLRVFLDLDIAEVQQR